MGLAIDVRAGLLLIVSTTLAGCNGGSQAGLQRALADYNAQRYSEAHERAAKISQSAPTGRREEAAYLAGLSAYQMGRNDEAERQLVIGSAATDLQTAAKARAMLGQVRLDQQRPREAASLLAEASRGLDGPDAQKAAYNAGIAYQRLGDNNAAQQWLATANGESPVQITPAKQSGRSSVAAGTRGRPLSEPASFTLQVGAFRERKRAQQAAEDAQKLASRDGLGQVRITPRQDERGRAIYVVQFGWFPTRDSAAAARAKLGRLEYIVAPSAGRAL